MFHDITLKMANGPYFRFDYDDIIDKVDTAPYIAMEQIYQNSNSRNTPIAHPHGRAMGVFCELFGEKWPWYIGSAL